MPNLTSAPGDYDRLTFVDDGNDNSEPENYPYNPFFLERRRLEYTYDRFSHYGTTYLCSGYGFTAVGKAEWFFENIILGHFRHHYFRMGLVAHYQRAALLYFSDELSNAIKTLAGKGPVDELIDPIFRSQLETVQMNFLKFRSRAYFPEVTNQLQGQELWKFWFDHLNSQLLFEIVDSSSERITSVLAQHETREMTKAQMRLAELQANENVEMKKLAIAQTLSSAAQHRLATIAKQGLVVSIVLSALSVVLAWASLFPDSAKKDFSIGSGAVIWGPWIWLIPTLLMAFLVFLGIRYVFIRNDPPQKPNPQ